MSVRTRDVFCLAGAALWTVGAKAQQSQSLTVEVAHPVAMATCDIGPPAAIPAEAQAAGFMHCVANFDFSQPTYAVPAWDLEAPASQHWYDCQGENPNVLWHQGSAGVNMYNPCTIHQKADPVTGQLVMNFQWLPVYDNKWGSQFGNGQFNQIGGQTFNNFADPKAPTLTVGNYYVETSNRIESPCGDCPANAGGPVDVYMWGYWGSPDGGGLEIDSPELQTNARGVGVVAAGNCGWSAGGKPCWSNWGANQKNLPSGYNALNFNTYGALLTSDGATNKYVCMYINDILQNDMGCLTAKKNPAGDLDNYFTNRSWILVSAGSNNGAATQPINFNVAFIRVWSCAAYRTSMCNGTTLSTSTLPTGQTLAYYYDGIQRFRGGR